MLNETFVCLHTHETDTEKKIQTKTLDSGPLLRKGDKKNLHKKIQNTHTRKTYNTKKHIMENITQPSNQPIPIYTKLLL